METATERAGDGTRTLLMEGKEAEHSAWRT